MRWIALVLLSGLALAPRAKAHDWYPASCCSNQDCSPVAEAEVSEDDAWYYYKGRPFAKHATKQSPDGRYHVCYIPSQGMGSQPFIRCMWRPFKGA